MGGTVQQVAAPIVKAAAVVASPVLATADTLLGAVSDNNPFEGAVKAVPKTLVKGAKAGVTAIGAAAQDIDILSKPQSPNIAIEDPAKRSADDKLERERAKRQVQVDILTDRPGRGGTILTDSYQYRV